MNRKSGVNKSWIIRHSSTILICSNSSHVLICRNISLCWICWDIYLGSQFNLLQIVLHPRIKDFHEDTSLYPLNIVNINAIINTVSSNVLCVSIKYSKHPIQAHELNVSFYVLLFTFLFVHNYSLVIVSSFLEILVSYCGAV